MSYHFLKYIHYAQVYKGQMKLNRRYVLNILIQRVFSYFYILFSQKVFKDIFHENLINVKNGFVGL